MSRIEMDSDSIIRVVSHRVYPEHYKHDDGSKEGVCLSFVRVVDRSPAIRVHLTKAEAAEMRDNLDAVLKEE